MNGPEKEDDSKMDLHPTDSEYGMGIEARTAKDRKAKTGPSGEKTGKINSAHKDDGGKHRF